jgi:hypothetical protein
MFVINLRAMTRAGIERKDEAAGPPLFALIDSLEATLVDFLLRRGGGSLPTRQISHPARHRTGRRFF